MKTPQTLKLACLLCIIALQAVTSEGQTVTKVAAGGYHSLFLKSDGSLWTMGDNDDGELGDGTYNQANLPEQIVASNITAIAAGVFHSLFLKSDGSLWTMGDNSYGELGDGTTDNDNYNTNLPEQIVASNVTAIAAGVFHSLFLKSDGSLWVMGNNGYGQLGDGTYNTTNLPEQIVASNVTAIAAGRYHSLFLKSDGSLWAMGYNASGQLGDGTYNQTNRPEQIVATNVTAIAAGYFHSLFLQSDGSLWAMGNNYDGQLGDGTTDNDNYNTNWPEQIVASNVTAIAGGGDHSLFLQSDGSLWAMGDNASGQLGDGTYNQINLPEQIVAGSSVPPGYNQISGQLLGTGDMQLSFVGIAGANYALDHSFSLAPPNWAPQLTNPTDAGGVLVFTNTPDPTTNNFWRIRSVP
jgi:alpha-tubulin suppressor-like RCC1 family protein